MWPEHFARAVSRLLNTGPATFFCLCLALGLALGGTSAAAASSQLTVQVTDQAGAALSHAVVELHAEQAAGAPVAESAATLYAMRQQGQKFDPQVLVVPRGASVKFPNEDKVQHHVYSFSAAKVFQLKLYSGDGHEPVNFPQAGLVELGCNIHDDMRAHILVSDAPWHGSTDAQGNVTLTDLVPGRYVVKVWHAAQTAAIADQQIEVTQADLVLPVQMAVARPKPVVRGLRAFVKK